MLKTLDTCQRLYATTV